MGHLIVMVPLVVLPAREEEGVLSEALLGLPHHVVPSQVHRRGEGEGAFLVRDVPMEARFFESVKQVFLLHICEESNHLSRALITA